MRIKIQHGYNLIHFNPSKLDQHVHLTPSIFRTIFLFLNFHSNKQEISSEKKNAMSIQDTLKIIHISVYINCIMWFQASYYFRKKEKSKKRRRLVSGYYMMGNIVQLLPSLTFLHKRTWMIIPLYPNYLRSMEFVDSSFTLPCFRGNYGEKKIEDPNI